MAKGGARPGAGRPRGIRTKWRTTLNREAAYSVYREEVLSHMAEIVRAQVQAATGVYEVLAVTSKGLIRVTDPAMLDRLLQSGDAFYRVNLKDPERYLTNQIVGKPKERVEVTGSHGDVPTVVKIVHEHYPVAPATSAPGGNGHAQDVRTPHQLPRDSE